MGEQFAIVFDVAVVATVVCMFFAGWRMGFAKVILSMLAVAVAFFMAMMLSLPIAEVIYNNHIEKPLTQKTEQAVDSSLAALRLGNFSAAQFDKVLISGTPVGEIEPNYSGTTNAVFDLTDLNFSEVGLTEENRETLGLSEELDLSSVNAKTADFTKEEIEKYGLGKLAFAQFAAVSLIQKGDLKDFNKYIEIVGSYFPEGRNYGNSDNITVSVVRKLVLNMLETNSTVKDTVMQNMIRPYCVIIIRTIVFAVIFTIVSAAIGIAANATKLLEKVPVIGKANSFVGGIAGACEGIVIIFIVCLATRLAVSLCDGNVLLFNQATIDSTFIFKRFYEADFLNFVSNT